MDYSQSSQRQSVFQDPPGVDVLVKKYLKIFKNRKKLIFFTSLFLASACIGFLILNPDKPVYSASVTLGLDNSRQGVTRDADIKEIPVIGLIQSNRLLRSIVDTLQLNFSIETPEVSKGELFSYIRVHFHSTPGSYRIIRENGQFALYYHFPQKKVREKRLWQNIVLDETIGIHNFNFRLNRDFVENYDFSDKKGIEFRIKDGPAALATLKNRITHRLVNRKIKNLYLVSVSARSPKTAAETANLLGEKIVRLNSEIRRQNGNERLNVLGDELRQAKKEWDLAANRLKAFKKQYPWISLNPSLTTVSSYEAEKAQTTDRQREISQKIKQVAGLANLDERITAARSLLALLIAESHVDATVLQTELEPLALERQDLRDKNQRHRKVRENKKQITTVVAKIIEGAQAYSQKIAGRSRQIESDISRERNRLNKLPEKEFELARLAGLERIKAEIYHKIDSRYNAARIDHLVQDNTVTIVDEAVSPPLKNAAAAFPVKASFGILLSLAAGLGLAIFIELFNKTAANAEELYDRLKLPVLGSIPFIETDRSREKLPYLKGAREGRLVTLDYAPTLESESYRELRAKILLMHQNKGVASFLLTSLNPDEGKSLTTANLAVTIAQQKIPTVLIDADIRRGVQHNIFGNQKRPGLSEFLISKATVDVRNAGRLVQPTFVPNLYLVSAGAPIPNPAEMLGSARMAHLLNVLKHRFGVVLMDTAPFGLNADAVMLANRMDASMLVIRAETTNTDMLAQRLQKYPEIRKNLQGVILNMVKVDERKRQMQYQYSYYNY